MSLRKLNRTNEEVLISELPIISLTMAEILELKDIADSNARHRARVNAHQNISVPLHEMLIVHKRGFYCQPHKHLAKSESFHIIEGRMKVILFDDDGAILQSITMGNTAPDETIFYRLSKPIYHMVILESDFAIYHEVTTGPFSKEDSLFAPWAPSEDQDAKTQQKFVSEVLANKILAV